MSGSLRIVIAGGGTGGHVHPAVAVMQVLRSKVSVEARWIGSREGVERDAAEENHIQFDSIQAGKLRRYFSVQTPVDALRIPVGIVQAFGILRRVRPDVVFSTGGFVSVPSVVAARLLGIPSITHEQTATVGLATRINARFASVVALTFERSRVQLGSSHSRVVVTGNPIRPSLFHGSAEEARKRFSFSGSRPLIYVTGGVLGAQAINRTVMEALPELLEHCELLHQCGLVSSNGDLPRLEHARSLLSEELRSRYVIQERIGPELADVYAAASLVVGRAGAGTVSELAALGKPSLLIPLPGTGGDEQTMNARVLEEAGASRMLPQSELNPERLVTEIYALLSTEKLKEMSAAAKRVGQSDAAERLADEILKLARRNPLEI